MCITSTLSHATPRSGAAGVPMCEARCIQNRRFWKLHAWLTAQAWWCDMMCVACTEVVPQWSTHVGNNTVLEDDVVFLHKQEELAVAKGLGRKPVAQVSTNLLRFRRCSSLLFNLLAHQ